MYYLACVYYTRPFIPSKIRPEPSLLAAILLLKGNVTFLFITITIDKRYYSGFGECSHCQYLANSICLSWLPGKQCTSILGCRLNTWGDVPSNALALATCSISWVATACNTGFLFHEFLLEETTQRLPAGTLPGQACEQGASCAVGSNNPMAFPLP